MFLTGNDGPEFEVRPIGTQKVLRRLCFCLTEEPRGTFVLVHIWGRLWSPASLKSSGCGGTSEPASFAI